MSCVMCDVKLNEKELAVYNGNIKEDYLLVCQKHWCACMPTSTPWRWIEKCHRCGYKNTLCKSCYGVSRNEDRVCARCIDYERDMFD
jgi:hypothetical protein